MDLYPIFMNNESENNDEGGMTYFPLHTLSPRAGRALSSQICLGPQSE